MNKSMENQTEIHVALLDEGTECWIGVQATHETGNIFKITSINQHPESDIWEFNYGDRVRCEERELNEGPSKRVRVLVAVSKAD